MLVIDAQVHAYERNHAGRPWAGVLAGPPEVTGDDMVLAMDQAGVDGALLVSPYTMYRYDASYALEVHSKYPNRFALIKPVDPTNADVVNIISDWATTEGAVAIRVMMAYRDLIVADHPAIHSVMKAAANNNIPVNLLCWGVAEEAGSLAQKNSNTQIIIDHLALEQPFEPPVPNEPFANLPQLLALAKLDNVAVKITGVCTLSKESYPYNDIWDPLAQIFDAFGFDRCLWGTDWTRAVNLLSYEQGVKPFLMTDRLNGNERLSLMGNTLARIYNWKPLKLSKSDL